MPSHWVGCNGYLYSSTEVGCPFCRGFTTTTVACGSAAEATTTSACSWVISWWRCPDAAVVTPEQAHEIALELAAQFEGYEVVVATHMDDEHIHSHLVVNSVSHATGRKLHQNWENH